MNNEHKIIKILRETNEIRKENNKYKEKTIELLGDIIIIQVLTIIITIIGIIS